jgi:hypothetical protein
LTRQREAVTNKAAGGLSKERSTSGISMDVRIEAQKERGAQGPLKARPLQHALLARARNSSTEWIRAHSVVPFGARPYAPALVWLVTAASAAAVAPHEQRLAVGIAAVGVVIAIAALRGPLAARALTALAMVPSASAHAPSWTWALSGGVVALLVSARGGPVELRSHDLQRHLDWCRRRQEKAHVLVMRFSLREVPKPVRLLDSFRTTDSIALHYSHGVCELQAVLDDVGFSREGVQRRITDGNDVGFRFGWTEFPADGVTLDSLLETARADLMDPRAEMMFSEIPAESFA